MNEGRDSRDDAASEGQPDETQEQVSRLLAAAAGPPDQTMPDDVADRLEGVLAGLVAERGSEGLEGGMPAGDAGDALEGAVEGDTREPVRPGEVTGPDELASRRRRWGPRLLLAAASVSVLALGVGVGVGRLTSSGDGGAMSGDSAASRAVRQGESSGPGPSDSGGSSESSGSDQASGGIAGSSRPPVPVRRSTLRADLQRIVDSGWAVPVAASRARWREACVHPRTGAGDEWVRVRLDGQPGLVVLRAPAAGRRTAEVFTCGSPGSPAASSVVDDR